ncbi:MAG TPA: SRPBCC domain-containing protein [Verrucomicrobiae bacterium]|nr:SRPBCC domain-containing protein [Verrucomicrobiae bacterium]
MAVKNSSGVQIGEQEIIISRMFNAPRALVWKVWTERRHLARWWGPKGFSTQVLEMDLRAGGVLHLQLRGPDGALYPCKGTYSEILEPERIVYRGAVEKNSPGCGAGLPPQALVTVRFVEQGANQTLLTLHTRFETAENCQAAIESGFVPGWQDSFDNLEEQLANR